MLVGGYTGRVRKARNVPRTRYLVDIVLWERCAIRGGYCGWHVILHVPAEWQNIIKMEDVFSYIHSFRHIGFLYRGASPSMVLVSYCCA